MNESVAIIPILSLALAFLPVLVVVTVLRRWSLDAWTPIYATARMLVQLVAVGYVLAVIFKNESPTVVLGVLSLMIAVASWIALRPVKHKSIKLYGRSLLAVAIGGGGTLLLMTQGILELEPWFFAQKVIPLGGMSLTAAMNCVSLAAERFETETSKGAGFDEARRSAMQASLITVTNSLLAVGIVSLPGFMTGQIIAEVSPLIAARYQIMIMCMAFGAGGIASAVYLSLMRPRQSCEKFPDMRGQPER